MNRWVLLEHKVNSENIVDVHYDFLMENRFSCLTWKVDQIPSINRCSVKIQKQPDHRLVWLSRSKYVLSGNRGLVTRVDNGTFLNISQNSNSQELRLIVNGNLLNGIFSIKGDLCQLHENK